MAIVDVTVIPIGTEAPSVSQYVADIQRILRGYEERDLIKFELTPMSTIIEGELSTLFEVIQTIHEAPFQKGIDRVATNFRIDDRRDKMVKMADKLESVKRQIEKPST